MLKIVLNEDQYVDAQNAEINKQVATDNQTADKITSTDDGVSANTVQMSPEEVAMLQQDQGYKVQDFGFNQNYSNVEVYRAMSQLAELSKELYKDLNEKIKFDNINKSMLYSTHDQFMNLKRFNDDIRYYLTTIFENTSYEKNRYVYETYKTTYVRILKELKKDLGI